MKIVMTGGGTSGHVTPNIALFDILKNEGWEISYIGTNEGVEKKLIENENIDFYAIKAGKLRRYIDKQNFTDIKKIYEGFREASAILKKIKPNVVFSKGGFVSCPVVWAAWFNKIPVVIHESDITPGLANKLSIPFATKICYAFPETKKYLPKKKSIFTGLPIREELFLGDINLGRELCGFNDKSPVLTVIGGSQGSYVLNKIVRTNLTKLLEVFQVCHICGEGNIDITLNQQQGYKQFEYVDKELKDIFAATDIFVSRAGATAIFEFLFARKPAMLIPLSKKASRGDQILNARSFSNCGYSKILEEENLTDEAFISGVFELYNNRKTYIKKMTESGNMSSKTAVYNVINSVK